MRRPPQMLQLEVQPEGGEDEGTLDEEDEGALGEDGGALDYQPFEPTTAA